MAPLRDAVRFIDGEERNAEGREPLAEAPTREALRRDVEQLDSTRRDRLEPSLDVTGRERRVHAVAGRPRASNASTWSFISEISGETTSVGPGRSCAGTW